MAPRANWRGFLGLSLVTCPVALYPATSDSEKVSFNQLNRKTGHRIKYAKVDADTGEEVANEDIVKGYKVEPWAPKSFPLRSRTRSPAGASSPGDADDLVDISHLPVRRRPSLHWTFRVR